MMMGIILRVYRMFFDIFSVPTGISRNGASGGICGAVHHCYGTHNHSDIAFDDCHYRTAPFGNKAAAAFL